MEEVLAALKEQTVTVAGTEAAATVIANLARSLRTTLEQRRQVAEEIEALLEAHPLSAVLTSMPGIGARTGARILIEVGDGSAFATAAHLASYAGLAPATRASGSSIRGEHPSRRGNKQLERALFLASFASPSHPPSRAYYDRKVSQGKHHNQALRCVVRDAARRHVLPAADRPRGLTNP